jgi:hypothetical protein
MNIYALFIMYVTPSTAHPSEIQKQQDMKIGAFTLRCRLRFLPVLYAASVEKREEPLVTIDPRLSRSDRVTRCHSLKRH